MDCYLPQTSCVPCTFCKVSCTVIKKCVHFHYRQNDKSSRFLRVECKKCSNLLHTHNNDDFGPSYSEFISSFRQCLGKQYYFKCLSKKHKLPMLEHRMVINLDYNTKSEYISLYCFGCNNWIDSKRIQQAPNAKDIDIANISQNIVVIKKHFYFKNNIESCH